MLRKILNFLVIVSIIIAISAVSLNLYSKSKLEDDSFNSNGEVIKKNSKKDSNDSSNSSSEVKNQIIVLFYNSKDDFAIKLITKSNDEVIFYKNPKGKTFNEIYSNMTNDTNKYTGNKNFSNNDTFKAPMINFNVKREYNELQNKPFYDDENREYVIEKAVQTINFKLDEKGGRVKSEAAIDTNVTSAPVKESRNFNVDDTFAIFLKESSRDMPYFAARIDDIRKYQ